MQPESQPGQPDAFDSYHAGRPDVLTWLQGWYAAQTNGDWEHSYGVTFGTLDNPGWSAEIDIADTELAGRPFERHEMHRSEDDWVVAWIETGVWHLRCGPLNLAEGLHQFRVWAGNTSAR